jgi:16S rRNA processing protein RimM
VGGDSMPKRVVIGKILTPHGVKGEFRVLPLTDFPERFKTLKQAYLQDGRPITIESARPHKQFFLVKLVGFDSVEAVSVLHNLTVEVERDAAVPLPPGHFYIFDIIGMHVYSETGETLGIIADVLETGSNDVYVIDPIVDGAVKKPQILIPALKDVVLEIDVAAKKMTVRLPEGLI